MRPNMLFFLEFILFSGLALAFAIQQVISVSPKKGDKKEGDEKPALPKTSGHSEG
jgi:hypothetical protein